MNHGPPQSQNYFRAASSSQNTCRSIPAAATAGHGTSPDHPAQTPTFTHTSISVSPAGTLVGITYNRELNPSDLPATTAFSVTIDGLASEVREIQTVFGPNIGILIYPPAGQGQEVRVSYRDKTSGNDATGVLQDTDGNDAPSFTNVLATNNSTLVRRPPVFTLGSSGYEALLPEYPGPGYVIDRWTQRDTNPTEVEWISPYRAIDPDGDPMTFSLEGRDADKFDINEHSDVLTKAGVVYDHATQQDCANPDPNFNQSFSRCFELTIVATDSTRLVGRANVVIILDNLFNIRRATPGTKWVNGSLVPKIDLRWDNPFETHWTKLKQFDIEYFDTSFPSEDTPVSGRFIRKISE